MGELDAETIKGSNDPLHLVTLRLSVPAFQGSNGVFMDAGCHRELPLAPTKQAERG